MIEARQGLAGTAIDRRGGVALWRQIADRLRGEGVTHLFFSRGDIGFMALHDPSGQHVAALRFFWSEFSGRHTRRVFSDEWVGVYELVSR